MDIVRGILLLNGVAVLPSVLYPLTASEHRPGSEGETSTRREGELITHREEGLKTRRKEEPPKRREGELKTRRKGEPKTRRKGEPKTRREGEPRTRIEDGSKTHRKGEPITCREGEHIKHREGYLRRIALFSLSRIVAIVQVVFIPFVIMLHFFSEIRIESQSQTIVIFSIAMICVSFSWWENFSDDRFCGKTFMKLKFYLQESRPVINFFTSLWKIGITRVETIILYR
ncbi:hypothetical protein DPMN_031821 [Dreissena polymorpha]|uniref:Uncharacterized protein n=1 Tax=Dreissena polymorpha TaxID=45954 RepID=A0A9D4M0Q0_DREPO|nr:hypothetical protein DPMN_031821 [Dreissena polymorpha]